MAINPAHNLADQELEFIAKHPGGFDRMFFEQILPQIVNEYAAQRGGLDATTMEVVMELADGHTIATAAVRVAVTWLMVITEADELHFVPHSHVIHVIVRRRQSAAPANPVGFTATSIDEGNAA